MLTDVKLEVITSSRVSNHKVLQEDCEDISQGKALIT